jgi:diacylglycerol kinase family enzyme
MRVDVFVNQQAGRARLEMLRERISRALFRCELVFHAPGSVEEMQALIQAGIEAGTDGLMVCGGDGTINHCLPPLMKAGEKGTSLPPVCIVPAGTANDLAQALNISDRADRAARAIFEGDIKEVDLIRIRDENGVVKYMVTNGGSGIGAFTAQAANGIKGWLKGISLQARTEPTLARLSGGLEKSMQIIGGRVYELPIIREIWKWNFEDWRLEVTLPDGQKLTSTAPIVLISNQARLANHFLPAPFTKNDDGKFNLLLIEAANHHELIRSVVDLRLGRTLAPDRSQQHEVTSVVIESRSGRNARKLVFFGDGEILFEDARRLEIECVHPGVRIMKMGEREKS